MNDIIARYIRNLSTVTHILNINFEYSITDRNVSLRYDGKETENLICSKNLEQLLKTEYVLRKSLFNYMFTHPILNKLCDNEDVALTTLDTLVSVIDNAYRNVIIDSLREVYHKVRTRGNKQIIITTKTGLVFTVGEMLKGRCAVYHNDNELAYDIPYDQITQIISSVTNESGETLDDIVRSFINSIKVSEWVDETYDQKFNIHTFTREDKSWILIARLNASMYIFQSDCMLPLLVTAQNVPDVIQQIKTTKTSTKLSKIKINRTYMQILANVLGDGYFADDYQIMRDGSAQFTYTGKELITPYSTHLINGDNQKFIQAIRIACVMKKRGDLL